MRRGRRWTRSTISRVRVSAWLSDCVEGPQLGRVGIVSSTFNPWDQIPEGIHLGHGKLVLALTNHEVDGDVETLGEGGGGGLTGFHGGLPILFAEQLTNRFPIPPRIALLKDQLENN